MKSLQTLLRWPYGRARASRALTWACVRVGACEPLSGFLDIPEGGEGGLVANGGARVYTAAGRWAMFTVGRLADAVTMGNERAMRKLLRDAGGVLDVYAEDRAEPVDRGLVIDLYAIRAADGVGRKLAGLLGG